MAGPADPSRAGRVARGRGAARRQWLAAALLGLGLGASVWVSLARVDEATALSLIVERTGAAEGLRKHLASQQRFSFRTISVIGPADPADPLGEWKFAATLSGDDNQAEAAGTARTRCDSYLHRPDCWRITALATGGVPVAGNE